MNYAEVQKIAKDTMAYAKSHIRPGMKLLDIREVCEQKMLDLGADSFWYWDVARLYLPVRRQPFLFPVNNIRQATE